MESNPSQSDISSLLAKLFSLTINGTTSRSETPFLDAIEEHDKNNKTSFIDNLTKVLFSTHNNSATAEDQSSTSKGCKSSQPEISDLLAKLMKSLSNQTSSHTEDPKMTSIRNELIREYSKSSNKYSDNGVDQPPLLVPVSELTITKEQENKIFIVFTSLFNCPTETFDKFIQVLKLRNRKLNGFSSNNILGILNIVCPEITHSTAINISTVLELCV